MGALFFQEFEICTFSQLFLFSKLKHPYSEYGTSYMSYHQQLSRILLHERRECKKADVFLGKFLLITSAGKIFRSAINIALRARNAITICYAWPADKFTFITPTKNRGTHRNPFPTAIFHKLAKIDALEKKCHFSIPKFKLF